MRDSISIITATRDGEDGLIVTFSDGTVTGFVAEELLELRPHREPICPRAIYPTAGKLLELQKLGIAARHSRSSIA
jgi:hypothetical protein